VFSIEEKKKKILGIIIAIKIGHRTWNCRVQANDPPKEKVK
jgi:hypothetical protein